MRILLSFVVMVLILVILVGYMLLTDNFPEVIPNVFELFDKPYDFPNKEEKIVSIDLLYNTGAEVKTYFNEEDIQQICSAHEEDYVLIRSLSEDEFDSFMTELYGLETGTMYPPWDDYGEFVVQVTYENGDREMFGSFIIAYIESDDRPGGVGSHNFKGEAFEEFFMKHAGEFDVLDLISIAPAA